jgi:segregation and condensation protein B
MSQADGDESSEPEPTAEPEQNAEPEPSAEVIEMAEARAEAEASAQQQAEEAGGAAAGEGAPGSDAEDERVPHQDLEGVVESLLFASDKPLSIENLQTLTGEPDGRQVTLALEALRARRQGTGVELAEVASGFTLRTRAAYAYWVSKLLAGRPMRLSRAMLETVAIIAYRQPITRPELDDIRGVDCGPVLGTLLDRGLIRIIGKKEEVGRPILYGTTTEFLRVFSLKDLTQLPTLRQFHELSAEHQATLEAKHGAAPVGSDGGPPLPPSPDPGLVPPAFMDAPTAAPLERVARDPQVTEAEADEDAGLLEELEAASDAANRAARPLHQEGEADSAGGDAPDGSAAPR